MLQFEWPWMILLLPLPWLVYRYARSATRVQTAALLVPEIRQFEFDSASDNRNTSNKVMLILAVLAWAFLVLSASRPQYLGEAISTPISGRDLMVALDLSDSMSTGDFEINGNRVNRLQSAKWVADDFIARRQGDRIGLILFADQAYLQVPLTFDLDTVRYLLSEAVLRLAGQKTAIGDAIGLAIKRLEASDQSSRVLILMTDGRTTAGNVDPIKSAEVAASQNIKIYTIGIGSRDDLELDIRSLEQIARITGGRFYRARTTDDLKEIYDVLDEIEKIDSDEQNLRPITALYHWPLAFALFLATVIQLLRLKS